MPVYDYACTVCGRTIEVTHGVHESGPTACEVCGGPMRKLLSPPAIVFKGSGWAKKDARAASHARSSRKPAAGSAPAPEGTGAGGAGSVPGAATDAPAGTSTTARGGTGGPGAD